MRQLNYARGEAAKVYIVLRSLSLRRHDRSPALHSTRTEAPDHTTLGSTLSNVSECGKPGFMEVVNRPAKLIGSQLATATHRDHDRLGVT